MAAERPQTFAELMNKRDEFCCRRRHAHQRTHHQQSIGIDKSTRSRCHACALLFTFCSPRARRLRSPMAKLIRSLPNIHQHTIMMTTTIMIYEYINIYRVCCARCTRVICIFCCTDQQKWCINNSIYE